MELETMNTNDNFKYIELGGKRIKLSKVATIESVGVKHVYDIEVKDHHNYYAGGILVHNCAYHDLMNWYGKRYGDEFYKVKDTFISYKAKRLLLYPAGPNKKTLRGRCLTGSTLINTNGGFIQLNELIKANDQVPVENLMVDTHNGAADVSHTYKGFSHTIKICTKNGFSVEGTPEHPMLVINDKLKYVWKRLDELQIGDFIVSKTKSNSPMYGKSNISMDLATLIGYHVANGYRNEISSDDSKVIERLYTTFKRVTGVFPTPYEKSSERAQTHYLKTGKKGEDKLFIRDYFEPLGYSVSSSKDKYIPLFILRI
jgi:hypothetical protein